MIIDTNYQTPPDVCEYMASLLTQNQLNVLEPTPGLGNLVTALKNAGKKVYTPDDYFLQRKKILSEKYWDAVVLNPPFSSKSAFLDNAPEEWEDARGMKFGYRMLLEAMTLSNTVIALMPWFTISDSDVRLRFIKEFGLRSITALPRKTFEYARIQTCVLVLEKGYTGTTDFIVYEFINQKAS